MKIAFQLLMTMILAYPLLQCSKLPGTHKITSMDTVITGEKTLLSLGDSYTIGQSIDENLRFSAQAVDLLEKAGIKCKSPDYVARTGWTTTNLSDALKLATLKPPYDFVTLLIGVNDQYQRMNIAKYKDHFMQLLNKSIEYAGGKKDHVIVISIPDYSITPFVEPSGKASVSSDIKAYNIINKDATTFNGCKYIDISETYHQGSKDLTLIADDNLHPSGKEYGKWAMKVAEYIETIK